MISYIISHELRQQDDRQEANIVATLEVFEDRCKVLVSVWFVCSPWSADQIRAHFAAYLGPEDSLIVEPVERNVECPVFNLLPDGDDGLFLLLGNHGVESEIELLLGTLRPKGPHETPFCPTELLSLTHIRCPIRCLDPHPANERFIIGSKSTSYRSKWQANRSISAMK